MVSHHRVIEQHHDALGMRAYPRRSQERTQFCSWNWTQRAHMGL
jgi:hypothetical protein